MTEIRRRAFLLGLGAAAGSAVLPLEAKPYPLPRELVPDRMQPVVFEEHGLYLVSLEFDHDVEHLELGIRTDGSHQSQRVFEVDGVASIRSMVTARPGDEVTAVAWGTGPLPAHRFRILGPRGHASSKWSSDVR